MRGCRHWQGRCARHGDLALRACHYRGRTHGLALIAGQEGLARLLQEAPISHDMLLVAEDDGSRLTATVNDSWELKWWVLSHAGGIQVHKPQGLRDEITQRSRAALELHER